METRRIRLTDLEQNKGQVPGLPSNPRQWGRKELDDLVRSIRETPELLEARGLIVWPYEGKYIILGGNMRFSALREMNAADAPCYVLPVDTPIEKLREITIKDNSSFGAWDYDMLANEWDDLPLPDWGVPAWDTAELHEAPAAEAKDVKEDDFDEEKEHIEVRCKRGDVWQLGDHRLMCGDSVSLEDVKKLMGGADVDMVFTDPPYGINIVNSQGKVGAPRLAKNRTYKPVKNDDSTDTAERNFEALKGLCSRMIIWGGNYFLKFLPPSDGWVVWDKRVDMNSNNFADGEMAWCSFHTPLRIYHQLWNGMIREGEHENRVHPTQKPVRMLSEVLRDFSNDGDNILDCFGGSGSTLMACEQTKRHCFIMEYDEHYCDVIIARWEAFTGKTAVKVE